jgi:hypothetical protein
LLALSVVSCSATLWDRSATAIQEELALGKTDFLFSQNAKTLAEADVEVLGEGAAWNLGALFAGADKLPEAEVLWKKSLADEGTPWREQAGRDLFDLYSARRDWPKAEAVAQRLAGFDANRPEFRRRLFEAYYFQKKDDQAWEIFRTWTPGMFSPEEELENRLFFGVLSARAGKNSDAAAVLRDLVFDHEASVLHFRLESFFQEDESRYALLGPGGREAVAFQSLVYQDSPKDVQAWFKGRKVPEGFWNHRALVSGIETVFKTGNKAEVGLRILEGIRSGLTGEAKFAAEYARGRLDRSLGWWPQARTAFQNALPLAVSVEDRKKTAWNWLNAWIETKPEGALAPFVQVYGENGDVAFFSDVFANWIPELIQGRHWNVLSAIWRDLGPRLDPENHAMIGFVLARLEAYGLISLAREGIDLSSRQLLEQSIAFQPYSYEALVARAVLGLSLEWPQADTAAEFHSGEQSRQQIKLWESMMSLGLAHRMAAEVSASAEPLDPAFVDRAVLFLQAHGQYRPSLQLLYRFLDEPDRVLTQERARMLYPRAYQTLAAEQAEAENLDPSLLMGLMREESSFDTEARSWVGAQGLTQLMPTTAAETAKGLHLKTFDLANPADNIKIGARFLSNMIRSEGRIYLALMAYNAGGGRIRSWKEAMGKLPEEIFVEAAPISETRGYVKKILTSTVMYGVLHDGKTLGEMVRLVYPGFQP